MNCQRSENGLPKAEPLFRSDGGATDGGARSTSLFVFVFFVAFLSILFLPVYPVPFHSDAVYWARPLEAYVLTLVAPGFAFPVAATHFGCCFYLAKFICLLPHSLAGFSFSIWFMLRAIAMICIVLSVSMRFGGTGFSALFFVTSIIVSFANLKQWKSIFGFKYPVWDQRVATVMFFGCSFLAANFLVWLLRGDW